MIYLIYLTLKDFKVIVSLYLAFKSPIPAIPSNVKYSYRLVTAVDTWTLSLSTFHIITTIMYWVFFSDIQEEKEKPSSDSLVDLTTMADGIQGDVCNIFPIIPIRILYIQIFLCITIGVRLHVNYYNSTFLFNQKVVHTEYSISFLLLVDLGYKSRGVGVMFWKLTLKQFLPPA